MKRHAALVSLSHDHHHALVQARRLRRAAEDPDADPAEAIQAFARFFAADSVPHFRREEEQLFPLVADSEEARPLLVRVLLDHQRLHALVARLASGDDGRPEMRLTAELLEEHVRREERELFPLIERLVADELERGLPPGVTGGGPIWGAESEDLNATILAWSPGRGVAEHVNEERDVLVCVIEGSAAVTVDGEEHALAGGDALIVPKGRRRAIVAGPDGVRYLSAHLRRPRLQIGRASGDRPRSGGGRT